MLLLCCFSLKTTFCFCLSLYFSTPYVCLSLSFCLCVVDEAGGQHLQLHHVPQRRALPHRTRRWDLDAPQMNRLHNLNLTPYCWGQQIIKTKTAPLFGIYGTHCSLHVFILGGIGVYFYTVVYQKLHSLTLSFVMIHLFPTILCSALIRQMVDDKVFE